LVTHIKEEHRLRVLVEKCEGQRPLEDLIVDGRKILFKWILNM
jgi:hypothetical protein